MAETKRYKVGPKQGFRTESVLKLTAEQAKRMGATEVVKMELTSDSAAAVDRYQQAMDSQEAMREKQRAATEEAAAAEQAKTKKRGAPAAADA
jgi:hypothetical protein